MTKYPIMNQRQRAQREREIRDYEEECQKPAKLDFKDPVFIERLEGCFSIGKNVKEIAELYGWSYEALARALQRRKPLYARLKSLYCSALPRTPSEMRTGGTQRGQA